MKSHQYFNKKQMMWIDGPRKWLEIKILYPLIFFSPKHYYRWYTTIQLISLMGIFESQIVKKSFDSVKT